MGRFRRVPAPLLAVAIAATISASACSPSSRPGSHPGSAAAPRTCRVPTPTVQVRPDDASRARAVEVMTYFARRAWNPAAPAARPSRLAGGLFVNYRPTWNGAGDAASQTNIRTDGRSDAQADAAARHDPLTDLVVLRDLDALLAAGVRNKALDLLRCRLQPVTEAEFVDYGPSRAWIYPQLVDLARLDPRGPWHDDAWRYARTLFAGYSAGIPAGDSFRPDWIAESAWALVDAGARFGRPRWAVAGSRLADELVRLGDPRTGLFPGEARRYADGRVVVTDPLVKTGSQAQLLDALVHVAQRTGSPTVRAHVRRTLQSLLSRWLGLHDGMHGGFFFAVDADGTGLISDYKETRQAWLLPLFRDAAAAGLLSPAHATEMTTVVRDRLYQVREHGYLYRVDPGWSPLGGSGATVEDWVSAEATGIAIEALLGPLR